MEKKLLEKLIDPIKKFDLFLQEKFGINLKLACIICEYFGYKDVENMHVKEFYKLWKIIIEKLDRCVNNFDLDLYI